MAGPASMAGAKTLDVAKFLQGLKFTPFHRNILILSCMVTFFDGLDFSLMSFTIPYIRDEMRLTESMMGYVSSAAFLGQMIGSLVGSYFGDIFGRRPVILISTVFSAVLTFITGYANTPEMLIVLRFLGGLGIGGLLAPAWSLNIESMPASMRATSVTIIMLGFSVGGAAAGQVTNFLAPLYGWEGVYFVSGVATFVLAIILQFTLPESVRWMVAKGKPVAKVMPLLERFEPGVGSEGYDSVILSDERKVTDRQDPLANFVQLFRGSLLWITPIIWLTYLCSTFAIYLKTSFGLLFLEKLGVPLDIGTDISSIGGLLGAIGGVVLLALTEKRGPLGIAIVPLLGIPLALLIGSGLLVSGPFFIPVVLLGAITIGAGHAAVISITSIYYPSAVRSTGGGWASFMAKWAAFTAPIIGGWYFLADKQAVLNGYLFTGLCLAGVVVGLIALSIFARRLATEREAEANAAPAPAE